MDHLGERDLGLLVVGVGFLGAQRAAAATLARGVQLIAVTDRDLNAANRVARVHEATVATTLQEGLKIPGIDIVVVATPNADHGEQVWQALDAGKHVLCEKPLAIDATEARALATMAQESQLRLATGFNHRFLSPVQDALRLVDQGSIGRVQEIRARIGYRASLDFLSSWHVDINLSGGGTLLDNGSHACDLIRQILGEASSVEGSVADQIGLPPGCESEAFVRFRGRDGGFAELWSSWTQDNGSLTLEILGSEGNLRIETAPWQLAGNLIDRPKFRRRYISDRVGELIGRSWLRCENSLVRELESFAQRGIELPQRASHATGWDGCRVTQMIQAAYESARSGKLIQLDPLPVRLPGERSLKEPIAA